MGRHVDNLGVCGEGAIYVELLYRASALRDSRHGRFFVELELSPLLEVVFLGHVLFLASKIL